MTDIPPRLLLAVAVGALMVAPFLGRPFARGTTARAGLDAFVVFGVASLVFFHVAPEMFDELGWVALALIAAGFVAARVLDAKETSGPAPVVAVSAVGALALHTALDGAALAGGHDGLGVAVVLHRLPVGLLAWSLTSARFGARAAWLVLVGLGAPTVLGYAFAETMLGASAPAVAAAQATVAGSLLHVLVRRERPGYAATGSARAAGVVGASLGVGLLAMLPGHAESADAYGARFVALLVASAPALVLGYVLAGLLSAWVPKAPLGWLAGRTVWDQAARGALFGLPLPICSCGVVPVYHGLVRRGMPAAAGFSFLVATPELGVESVLLSLPLLGRELTILRLVSAAVVAVVVGVVASRFVSPSMASVAPPDGMSSLHLPWLVRLRDGLAYGLGEVVETTAPWILVGLALAAIFDEGQIAVWVSAAPPGADVFAAALLGLPMYVCASGATPLAAGLIFSGISPGAAVAFLLSGPATNVTTFGVVSRLFGRRVAVVFGATVVVAAVVSGMVINRFLVTPNLQVPALHDHAAWWQWLSLAILSVLVLTALFRRGVFGFVAEVVGGRHGHDLPVDVDLQSCEAVACCGPEEAT